MIVVSSNINNILLDLTKLEADDLHFVLETALDDFDFSGDEAYYRIEKSLKKLVGLLDDYLEHNNPKSAKDVLVP